MKQVWLGLALGFAWFSLGALQAAAASPPGKFGFPDWDSRSGGYDHNRREPMQEQAPKEDAKNSGKKGPQSKEAPKGEPPPWARGGGKGWGPGGPGPGGGAPGGPGGGGPPGGFGKKSSTGRRPQGPARWQERQR